MSQGHSVYLKGRGMLQGCSPNMTRDQKGRQKLYGVAFSFQSHVPPNKHLMRLLSIILAAIELILSIRDVIFIIGPYRVQLISIPLKLTFYFS